VVDFGTSRPLTFALALLNIERVFSISRHGYRRRAADVGKRHTQQPLYLLCIRGSPSARVVSWGGTFAALS